MKWRTHFFFFRVVCIPHQWLHLFRSSPQLLFPFQSIFPWINNLENHFTSHHIRCISCFFFFYPPFFLSIIVTLDILVWVIISDTNKREEITSMHSINITPWYITFHHITANPSLIFLHFFSLCYCFSWYSLLTYKIRHE